MKSFFDYFTQNKIDASWAYILICAIPVCETGLPRVCLQSVTQPSLSLSPHAFGMTIAGY